MSAAIRALRQARGDSALDSGHVRISTHDGPVEGDPFDGDPRVHLLFRERSAPVCRIKVSRVAVRTVTRKPCAAKPLAVANARYTPPPQGREAPCHIEDVWSVSHGSAHLSP